MGIPDDSVVKNLPAVQEVVCNTGAAAAAAKFTSIMSNSVRPHRRQPTRLPLSVGLSRQEYWSGLPLPSLATQETLIQFLGREYPLEKEMANHFSSLAWEIP